MQQDRLQDRIQQATARGQKALIPYLPAGFPDPERFWQEILALDQAGADIIEIGIPFSDPVADGPVVEEACQQALAAGISLDWVFQGLEKIKSSLQAEIVLMGYVNPFLQYGWEHVAARSAECGVSGIIVPDLPLEESGAVESLLQAENLTLIRLIGLNTSLERMRLYAQGSRGFVYFVAVMGTTGSRQEFPPELKAGLSQARQIFSQPLALGFGLSHPGQIEPIQDMMDAVVFGSSLIQHLQAGGSSRKFISRWRS
ncbi:MAG: tryptophan synthase subunit alpha [Thermodesulfobacteriota bacterium]